MATKKHTAGTAPAIGAAPAVAADQQSEDLFQPFKWHTDGAEQLPMAGHLAMNFAGLVMDVARGTQTILEIIQQDKIDTDSMDSEGHGLPRLMSPSHASSLQRLCIASLGLLLHEADGLICRANDAAKKLGAHHG